MVRERNDDLGGAAAPDLGVTAHPPTHFVSAVLLTLCCFPPGGLVAIFYALQVNAKWSVGDSHGARRASELAKTWCWLAFGVGLIADFVLAAFLVPHLNPQSGR